MTVYIRNWAKHQHFKDRTPPWIKLYRDILDDPDWHDLSGDDAKLLVSLWLIASEDETRKGALPVLRKLAFRLRMKESEVNQALTRLSNWLIHDDIDTISGRYQSDAPETEGETETETKRETKRERGSPSGSRLPADWQLPVEWAEWAKQERPDLDPAQTAQRFADYWHGMAGAKARKADWLATWRNWCRAEKKQPTGALKGQQTALVSFAQQDELARRRRWEEMTGRKWPERTDCNIIEADTITGAALLR